ncbi:glutathione S-transferas-like protein [Lentithecium fluviatile CBS 122367]|uniref:Glutathione S-transferas-like protein n=1 Tax=Lentithecium fluviatile CBS 122367 TaxID=1168545 RepID=A0A6G1J6N2_9PLEO|nr:glutathione S-transferas-like protein [Lentithecium fluviatile CBS 122367]
MVLTLHHLGISQSERIVWLLEELGIEYKLVKYVRDPVLAPESLKSIPGNATGKAPFLEDLDAGITLSESGAICEYIMAKYAGKDDGIKLNKKFAEEGYVDYIYWFHWVNAGLQPAMLGSMFFDLSPLPEDDQTKAWTNGRLHAALRHIDERLRDSKWLAGDDFTAADIMVVYSLTTQRYYGPLVGYEKFPNIVRFLKDAGEREAYRSAMEKGDPEMTLLIGAEAPKQSILAAGGVGSDIWKK